MPIELEDQELIDERIAQHQVAAADALLEDLPALVARLVDAQLERLPAKVVEELREERSGFTERVLLAAAPLLRDHAVRDVAAQVDARMGAHRERVGRELVEELRHQQEAIAEGLIERVLPHLQRAAGDALVPQLAKMVAPAVDAVLRRQVVQLREMVADHRPIPPQVLVENQLDASRLEAALLEVSAKLDALIGMLANPKPRSVIINRVGEGRIEGELR